MYKLLLVSIFIISVSSCSDDSNLINEVHEAADNHELTNDIMILRTSVLDSTDYGGSGLISPPADLLSKMLSDMHRDTVLHLYADSLTMIYGNLRLGASLLSIGNATNYIVTVPFEKDLRVSGLLFYLVHGDHYHFAIISYDRAREIIDMPKAARDTLNPIFIHALHDMHYFSQKRLVYTDTEVSEFFANQYNGLVEDHVQRRAVTVAKEWTVTVYDDEGNVQHQYTDYTYVLYPCRHIFFRPGLSSTFYVPPNSKFIGVDRGGSGPASGGEYTEKQIARGAVQTIMDLDDDCDGFSLTDDVLDYLADQVLNSFDPCSGQDGEQMIADLLDQLCYERSNMSLDLIINGSEGELEEFVSTLITTDDLDVAMAGVDKIVPAIPFENCDKVKCVYDLLDDLNNGLFCSTFGELFDSEEFTLELFSGPRSSIAWYADGETRFNGNTISITIADDFCDDDTHPLDIASTLLHEAIHAAMYQSALIGDPNLNSTDYCLIWQDHFQTNDPCHEVMANQYVQHLAQAIADLDGNRFSLDYYMYSAWAGLSSVGQQVGLLSDPYVSQYYDEYQILIDSPFDECR